MAALVNMATSFLLSLLLFAEAHTVGYGNEKAPVECEVPQVSNSSLYSNKSVEICNVFESQQYELCVLNETHSRACGSCGTKDFPERSHYCFQWATPIEQKHLNSSFFVFTVQIASEPHDEVTLDQLSSFSVEYLETSGQRVNSLPLTLEELNGESSLNACYHFSDPPFGIYGVFIVEYLANCTEGKSCNGIVGFRLVVLDCFCGTPILGAKCKSKSWSLVGSIMALFVLFFAIIMCFKWCKSMQQYDTLQDGEQNEQSIEAAPLS